ncbi:hypothetical protein N7486_008494 [Penicillium sp. IBT 16267x]|nr:hypothetical protein N7486_008494 [Penicillium sp. IBT 16267x]
MVNLIEKTRSYTTNKLELDEKTRAQIDAYDEKNRDQDDRFEEKTQERNDRFDEKTRARDNHYADLRAKRHDRSRAATTLYDRITSSRGVFPHQEAVQPFYRLESRGLKSHIMQ